MKRKGKGRKLLLLILRENLALLEKLICGMLLLFHFPVKLCY